jgi:hypothetical protein
MAEPVRSRGKLLAWILVTFAVIGLFVCGGGLALLVRPKNGIQVERLEADLNARLPDGSTWEQAEAWFASHGLEPGVISDPDGRKIGLGAFIPNDSWLVAADITIEVYFSPKEGLNRRLIYRFVYGP